MLTRLFALSALAFVACKPAKTCGPSNCNGCCTEQNACATGSSTTSCGRGGNLCKACSLAEMCVATTGTCLESTVGGGSSGGSIGGGNVGGGLTAGGNAGGATAGGMSNPNTVEGICVETWASNTDGGTRPCAFGTSTPVVVVPLEDGGYQSIPTSVRADGTFTVQGVPPGPYFIRVSTTWYRATERNISLSFESIGRVDGTLAATGTTLNVAVNGLLAWDRGHFANLYSPNLGLAMENLASTPVPLGGETNFSFRVPYDLYSSALGARMINSSVGDDIVVTQTVFDPMSNELRTVGVGAGTAVNMVSGQTNSTMVNLAPPPMASTPLDVNVPSFTQYAGELTGGQPYFNVRLTMGPRGVFTRLSDAYALVYMYRPTPGSTTLPGNPLAYPNPFPSSWGALAQVIFTTDNPRALPGGQPRNYTSVISQAVPIQELSSQVSPSITPPLVVQINGMPFGSDQANATQTPTLSWTHPTLGRPSRYLVRAEQLQVSSGRTVARIAANFWLLPTDTTFTFPPNLLASGQPYVFTLTAYKTSGDVTREFAAFYLPVGTASVVSGIIRP